MLYILLTLALICAIICSLSRKTRRSLLMAFILVWSTIIILYSIKLFDIFEVAESTLKMYFLGICFFFAGFLIVRPKVQVNFKYDYYDKNQRNKYRLIKVFFWISFIVFCLKTLKALPYWASPATAVSNLKSAIVDDDALSIGVIGNFLFTYLAIPMTTCLMALSVLLLLKKKRSNEEIKIILMSMILLIPRFLSSGSKTAISLLVIMMVGYVFLFTKMNLGSFIRHYKKLFILSGGCLFLVLLIMSIGGETNVFESLYFYYVGCIPCSDYALQELNHSPSTYGLVSLNGFFRLLIVVPAQIGIGTGIKDTLDLVFLFIQQFEDAVYVAPAHPYNAFISMFAYFYADGGYSGVILFSFVYGIICALLQNWANRKPSYQSVGVVLVIFYGIITSMVRFQFFMVPFAAGISYILLLLPKTSIYSK